MRWHTISRFPACFPRVLESTAQMSFQPRTAASTPRKGWLPAAAVHAGRPPTAAHPEPWQIAQNQGRPSSRVSPPRKPRPPRTMMLTTLGVRGVSRGPPVKGTPTRMFHTAEFFGTWRPGCKPPTASTLTSGKCGPASSTQDVSDLLRTFSTTGNPPQSVIFEGLVPQTCPGCDPVVFLGFRPDL